jgi:hypothetical protein
MGKRPSLFSVSPPREFTFHRKPLRVFTHEQGPRFVAADIAKLLKYRDETALQTALGKAGCLLTPASGPALLTLKPSCAMYCAPAAATGKNCKAGWTTPCYLRKAHADQDKLQLAYALAGEAARQVGQAVWESVLAGRRTGSSRAGWFPCTIRPSRAAAAIRQNGGLAGRGEYAGGFG